MVKIDIEYQGNLHTEALHTLSGTRLTTDAPLDNGGKGESFSPTDLLATALGTCMVTIMGIHAEKEGLDIRGTKVTVNKEMIAKPVRRVGKLSVTIEIPLPTNHSQRIALEKAALTCPVHQSLNPAVEIPVSFLWTDFVKKPLETSPFLP
jgi:putative redox protein